MTSRIGWDMRDLNTDLDAKAIGSDMYDFVAELFPLCRSITGDGIRETFHRIGKRIPLDVHEVASDTPVLDWTVPKEWNIRQAYINDPGRRRVVDFRDHNLHVVGYSTPIEARMSLSQLKEHIHTLPEQPHLIPYRTSYYAEGWGFCMEDERLSQLQEGEYEVRIDSTLEPGSLTYAECYLAGDTSDEILISCHCCHPSMANDNLSGIALATMLADHLRGRPNRYSYRFLFIPGTIGSITWLARNEERIPRIKAGLVATCVGDPGDPTYKRSRQGNALIDRAATHVLEHSGRPYRIVDFSPYGYDERQYCSPGFDLAVGSLSRTPHNEYAEYHTSADNLDLVRPECLADSFGLYLSVLDVLENDERYQNLVPKGEPQLGRRGLYPSIGAQGVGTELMARLWLLNLSDGQHSLLDVADRSGLPFRDIKEAARVLSESGVLAGAPTGGNTH
jgi:aminopeptidase-like protein